MTINQVTHHKLLSPREQQVVMYMIAGLTYKQIALLLGIKLTTVKTHASRVYTKMCVHNITDLVFKMYVELYPVVDPITTVHPSYFVTE